MLQFVMVAPVFLVVLQTALRDGFGSICTHSSEIGGSTWNGRNLSPLCGIHSHITVSDFIASSLTHGSRESPWSEDQSETFISFNTDLM